MVLGILASLSSVQGLLIWPSLAPFFLHRTKTDRLQWLVAGFFTIGVYLLGFNFGISGGPGYLYALTHPVIALKYFFVACSGIFAISNNSPGGYFEAGVLGIVLFGAAVYSLFLWWRHPRDILLQSTAAWILFALFFDLLLVIGRSGFGIPQALSSRYTTYNLLLLVAVYVTFVRAYLIEKHPQPKYALALGVVGLLMVIQVSAGTRIGLLQGYGTFQNRIQAADLVVNYETSSAHFPALITQYVFPDVPVVLQDSAWLAEHRLNVFSEPQANMYRSWGVLPGGTPGPLLTIPSAFRHYLLTNPFAYRAWVTLSTIYDGRSDLQAAFGSGSGFDAKLLQWATTSGVTIDGDAPYLIPYKAQLFQMYHLLKS